MSAKNDYRELCRAEATIHIFSKDWWLDAVCGPENWDVTIVKSGSRIDASLPYYLVRQLGCKVITMPHLTQTMGVWTRYPKSQKYVSQLSLEKKVMTELIDNLPRFDYFQQNFHNSVTNWLPFYWKGFRQTTNYTYIIEDLGDLDRVFQNFKSNIRGKIRKAEKRIEVTKDSTIEDFYRLNQMTFERQNLRPSYSLEFVQRIDQALKKHKAREIFFAVDAEGRQHSALYLIWDEQSSYVHMVGEDYNLRSSGAGILLVWEAIKFTSDTLGLNRFDFEGSMIESIEEVRRSFGARQTPYFTIMKANLRGKTWRMLRTQTGRFVRAFRSRRW